MRNPRCEMRNATNLYFVCLPFLSIARCIKLITIIHYGWHFVHRKMVTTQNVIFVKMSPYHANYYFYLTFPTEKKVASVSWAAQINLRESLLLLLLVKHFVSFHTICDVRQKFNFYIKNMVCNTKKERQISPFSVSLFCCSHDAQNSSELILPKDNLYPLLQNTKKIRVNLNLLREFPVPSNFKLGC